NAPWARSLGGRPFFSGIGRGERAVLNEAADDIASLQSWIASMSGRIDEQAKAIAQLQSALGAVMDVLIESGGGAVDGDMLRHRVEEAIDAFQSRPAQRPTGEGGPYREGPDDSEGPTQTTCVRCGGTFPPERTNATPYGNVCDRCLYTG